MSTARWARYRLTKWAGADRAHESSYGVGGIGMREHWLLPSLVSGLLHAPLLLSALGATASVQRGLAPNVPFDGSETVDIEREAQTAQQAVGCGISGHETARLPISQARPSASHPRAPSGAVSELPKVGATRPGAADRIPTAAFAPIESPNSAPGSLDSTHAPVDFLMSSSVQHSTFMGERQAPRGNGPGGAGLGIAGTDRGAGTGTGVGAWDGGGGRGRGDLSRKPFLGGSVQWDCPFPAEATTHALSETLVRAQADVAADGTPTAVTILEDPGFGFGEAARSCVLAQRMHPALDRMGVPVRGTTNAFRVVFQRERAP